MSYPTWKQVSETQFLSQEHKNGKPDYYLERIASDSWLVKYRDSKVPMLFKTRKDALRWAAGL